MINLDEYEPDKEELQLKFGLEVSIEYHRRRAQFLLQFDRMSKFVALVTGSAYVFKSLEGASNFLFLLGMASAILALVTLVFRISEKASDHLEAMRNFSTLLIRFLAANDSDDKQELIEIERERREIETKNYYQMSGLVHVCYNAVARSWGRSYYYKISFFERAVSQFVDLPRRYKLFDHNSRQPGEHHLASHGTSTVSFGSSASSG